MSAPGHGFLRGRRLRASIRGVFLFLRPWWPIGSWETARTRASLKQIRAALSFAYKHWDLKNPFAKIEPPLHKESRFSLQYPPAPRFLKARQQGYGSALAFHLANALFQRVCRFDELIQLTWSDCQRVAAFRGDNFAQSRGKGFAGDPGIAPPQEYPHDRALYRWL
jgi:hypothetical protein